jgi:putative transposase
MARPLRTAPGGLVYHVLNRANARRTIFDTNADYLAFERVLGEVQERVPMRILAWCLMPNHWHLVLWPINDGDLSDYMRLVTLIHTQRWHAHRRTAGNGHIYQGRFKSFVVQTDRHFLAVCRYVEANALRANLVRRAEEWRWGSLWRASLRQKLQSPRLDAWPVVQPPDWADCVNERPAETELDAVRACTKRGTPYGEMTWAARMAEILGIQCSLRPRGRPKKGS